MSGDVLKEELMAPSAVIAAVDGPSSTCSAPGSPATKTNFQHFNQIRGFTCCSTAFTSHCVAEFTGSKESGTSSTDAPIASSVQFSIREPSPLRRQGSCEMLTSELAQPEVVSSPAHEMPKRSSSSLEISCALPERSAVVTCSSPRRSTHCQQ
ncbi:hypothetical protein GQ600_24309 [Phytophthora cactorum]|nr:hypothetical protein GQ600_24309 [Phytophthora cactorum]